VSQSSRKNVPFSEFLTALIGQPSLPLALGAFLIGLLGNVLADLLGRWRLAGIAGNWIILALLTLGVLALYRYHCSRMLRPLIEMIEGPPAGKAGLIILLSPLNPNARGTPEEVQQRTRQVSDAVQRITSGEGDHATDADYAALFGTNLEPELRAIEFHYGQKTLRDCWTIGTEDEQRDGSIVEKGSIDQAILLERWFNHLHPGHSVVFDQPRAVKPREYITLWNTVDGIFRTCQFKPDAVICDITGGLKLMSIGAGLACIGGGRTMQYMATRRDWKGDPLPQGQMAPILVDINPYLTARPSAVGG